MEEEVLQALSTVCEQCTGKDVIALGLAQELFINPAGEIKST